MSAVRPIGTRLPGIFALACRDGIYGANPFAGTTIYAGLCVNYILAVAFGNSAHWALAFAGTARNTVGTNFVRHKSLLPFITSGIEKAGFPLHPYLFYHSFIILQDLFGICKRFFLQYFFRLCIGRHRLSFAPT